MSVSDRYRYMASRLPELVLFSSDDERKQALRQARRMTHPGLSVLGSAFASALGSALLLLVTYQIFPALRSMLGLCGALIGALTGATASLTWLWVTRPRVRRSLREQLVERGLPVCLECGYDLRGQIDPRCPECATPFDEKLLRASRTEREVTRETNPGCAEPGATRGVAAS